MQDAVGRKQRKTGMGGSVQPENGKTEMGRTGRSSVDGSGKVGAKANDGKVGFLRSPERGNGWVWTGWVAGGVHPWWDGARIHTSHFIVGTPEGSSRRLND